MTYVNKIGNRITFEINPYKARLFEGSLFWGGGQFDLPSYFKKDLSNINITLYNC